MNLLRDALMMLAEGSTANHEAQPFYPKKGNFTLVTDAPELRFHDGKTPGGVRIPLDARVHGQIKQLYENQRSKSKESRS